MILSSTSDIVRIVTTSTADIQVYASWADITTSAFSPDRTNTIITSATTTTVVGSPASSTQRQVKTLSISNRHASTSNTVTVQEYDGTNSISVFKATLAAGESAVYTGTSWIYYDSSGKEVVVSSLGNLTGPITSVGAATSIASQTGTGTTFMMSTDPALTVAVPVTTSVGYLGIPQNSQSAAYTAVITDAGKSIDHPSTDANARTFTIPANGSVAYPVGTAISFSNMTSQVVSIAITTDTMYLAGTGTTGTRSLAQYGVATARKITSTTWLISGIGLT